ncbi:MAG TPA: YggS family pyridoxal phosphate-dependent enzyme [Ohtaekwangia sp.]|nr:YggS family pyridoxal phosphate-dependent enzyme [Ohtaekwangia sp.]
MNIKNNIKNFRENLPPAVKLIAVSKTQPVEKIQDAYDAGQRVFGENKVQELTPKYEQLPKDIEWHMIGHLQSNKVKFIAPFVQWIHSVDSEKLLAEINRQAARHQRTINCLLQIHIAQEETKFGFSQDEALALLSGDTLSQLGNIRIAGLMGMATFTNDAGQVRKEFRSLKSFFETLKTRTFSSNMEMRELSMGMSGDYATAIEEGSTMIRVGTAIFGGRT